MIRFEQVLQIQAKLVEGFGGADGIRDRDALDSAINRPFQTFNKTDLYPTAQSKAAAIIESILINHPFVDGNKRIGYFLMRSILLSSGKDISAVEDEKYELVIGVAAGIVKFDQILSWLEDKMIDFLD